MDFFSSYNLIIEASLILIISFIFNGIAKRTNIPAVLMLIALGVVMQFILGLYMDELPDFFPFLEVLGIIGLIMIVLEAALELKLKREKLLPIFKSMGIALVGLFLSTWVAALILHELIPEMNMTSAWLYATPLSILSSAIIIPSVADLEETKKEFHIYESTFSDIFGIMLFYYLIGDMDPTENTGLVGFSVSLFLTILFSIVLSYVIIYIFQRIKSQLKLFLLIAVLLLMYAIGKKLHLSSLLIILIFGLVIANMEIFFGGVFKKYLNFDKARQVYHELHLITLESAFVVRTYFFVIFGLTIVLSTLFKLKVLLISALILISIYLIRYALLRLTTGSNITPQLYIAPRGLITVLLFYAIPAEVQVESFEPGILLFVIILTSVIMTYGMIKDKRNKQALESLAASSEEQAVKAEPVSGPGTSEADETASGEETENH